MSIDRGEKLCKNEVRPNRNYFNLSESGPLHSEGGGVYAENYVHLTVVRLLCKNSESESYITTDGQSPSLSWNKAPICGLRPDFYYCLIVAGLLIWGALSDEKTGLSFTMAAGPRQRSHSRVRVPWDLWPYFTVSDWRLPFSSPPTTRRLTIEVFDPASARVCKNS
jgi:hypothetical protein